MSFTFRSHSSPSWETRLFRTFAKGLILLVCGDVFQLRQPDYYWAITARGDYTINSKQQIFGHYVQSRRLQPGKNGAVPGLYALESAMDELATRSGTESISPDL